MCIDVKFFVVFSFKSRFFVGLCDAGLGFVIILCVVSCFLLEFVDRVSEGDCRLVRRRDIFFWFVFFLIALFST